MPIASGSEMMSARIAAQTVPKISGQTYSQKLPGSREAVSFVATKAGRLYTIRKIATAARVTRIMLPANTAEREKTRSPRLRTGLEGFAVFAVEVTDAPGMRRGRDGVLRRERERGTARGAAPRPGQLIAAIAVSILPRRSAEIGALPAASAASFCPCSLTM